jgi:predicted acylesterase/phospholipase RssA
MILNAVFQGGGVKGLALVGALEKIEEVGITFQAVSGASAGSIVAALYAAGYSAAEMKTELETTDISSLLDPFRLKFVLFLKNKGLYKGNKLYQWLHELLAKKGVRTFGDLGDIDLKVIASDLTNRELIVFDRGGNPTLNVAEAVRMSIGIPMFFKAYAFGERLVVDGGVLSNFPLFSFAGESNTLGFKIVPDQSIVPTPPKGLAGLVWSLAGTMMDAHDKLDEQEAKAINIIRIPDGGIPSVKFALSKDEKLKLYQNGYHAASKFLSQNDEFFDRVRTNTLVIPPKALEPLKVRLPVELGQQENIRVSISALFRVLIDGKYLLVKGRRIDQFQPVGGVLKRLDSSKALMRELGVLDDKNFPIDDSSRDDLRVHVPFASLSKFLEWFVSAKDRETSPWREFYEELIGENILPAEAFHYANYEEIRTHVEGIRFSEHFHCHELLVAEIYHFLPNGEQSAHLRELQKRDLPAVLWAEAGLIERLGYDPTLKRNTARISEHSKWIL